MKRGVLVTGGVLLLLLGIALVVAGSAVAAVLGRDGAIVSAPARVAGTGVAVVADDVTVDAGSLPIPAGMGDLTFTVRSTAATAVFVGTAAPGQVDAYLTGAPYDVVVDLVGGQVAKTRKVPGTQQPQPPAQQKFWTLRASGSPATFGAVPSDSSLVIMNADARPGIDAEVTARFTVRNAWTGAWTAVGAGAAALVLAVVCFWRARVARRRAVSDAATTARATAGLETSAVTVLPEDSSVGRDDAAGLVEATVAVVPATTGSSLDETAELPVSPPWTGEPVDVAPEDEPAAQGGSETLAALVADASRAEVASVDDPGTEGGGSGLPSAVHEPPLDDAPDETAVEQPNAGDDDAAPSDPLFAEIAERWGLLPAEHDPAASQPAGSEVAPGRPDGATDTG